MSRTLEVKNQLEVELSYSFTMWREVGELAISGSGTGTYTADTAIWAGGCILYARVEQNAIGSAAVVLTVTGAGGTGTCTIPARSQEHSGFLITDDYGAGITFDTVTSVAFTGGTAGEKIEIIAIPPTVYWADPEGGLIGFDNGFNFDPGTTSRAIPNKYIVVDHYKRARGETSININHLYQSFEKGMVWLRNRNVLLKAEIHDDGGTVASETYYFNKTRLMTTPTDFPDNADGAISGSGSYDKFMCIEEG